MSESEITQPEEAPEVAETTEAVESAERAEEQAVEEATHDPGARVEETQTFEQAEAVEEALTEAVETAEPAEEDIPPAESGPDPQDLPAGSGILEEPGQTLEMAEEQGDPGPAGIVEVPEGVEIELAGDADQAGTVDRDDPGRVEDPELSETSQDEDDEGGEEATPINLPGPVTAEVALDHPGTGGRVAQQPEPGPIPPGEALGEDIALDHTVPGGRVVQEPEPGPVPSSEAFGEEIALDQTGPGGRVAQQPEPDPVPPEEALGEEIALDHTSPGGRVAQQPDPDPVPPEEALGEEIALDLHAPGRNLADVADEIILGSTEAGLETELIMEQEGEEDQEDLSEEEETGEAPDWYLYEDKDGNVTVVDENGNPVDSPPIVYTYEGKTYITYPGDEPAIAPDGTIKDPSKLIELPNYTQPIKDMYLHEDKDGNITVVDGDGVPVSSPPIVFTYQGKTYVSYGEPPIAEDGTLKDSRKLIELPDYKQDTKNMYLHEDKDGNITVVDENGVPVDSPPIVFTYQGKTYVTYPGDDPINPDGTIKDPSKLIELSDYKPAVRNIAKEMYLHEDKDGNFTVVDKYGKPVNSPPIVYTYQGKTYVAYPGDEPAIATDGTIKDPSKLIELSTYKQPVSGMYLHEDKDGNITVVDAKGNPVDSPPIVYTYQGKTYAAYPGDETGIAPDGTIENPTYMIELPTYKAPIKDMYLHEDKDGNITVVDGDGVPVNSPPIVFTYQGKTYVTYPGDDPINPDGTIKDPSKLIELPNYKPPWWKKKIS